MLDVRKLVGQGVLGSVVAASLAVATQSVGAQATKPRHRETNASREARIQRTIDTTYSHQWEIFGGGGYLRFRAGDALKKNNEVTWETSASRYLNPHLAIVGDVRGSFGNAHALPFSGFAQIPNPQINQYFFLGGANYRFYRREKFAASVEGLAGAGWGIFSGGSKGIAPEQLGMYSDGTRPAFSASLHGDYNFYPNLAFRVSPTYVPTTFGGSLQNNLGINFGLVYRFGHSK